MQSVSPSGGHSTSNLGSVYIHLQLQCLGLQYRAVSTSITSNLAVSEKTPLKSQCTPLQCSCFLLKTTIWAVGSFCNRIWGQLLHHVDDSSVLQCTSLQCHSPIFQSNVTLQCTPIYSSLYTALKCAAITVFAVFAYQRRTGPLGGCINSTFLHCVFLNVPSNYSISSVCSRGLLLARPAHLVASILHLVWPHQYLAAQICPSVHIVKCQHLPIICHTSSHQRYE